MSQLPKASDYLKSKGWKPDKPDCHPQDTPWRHPKVQKGGPFTFGVAVLIQDDLDKGLAHYDTQASRSR